MTQFCRIVHIRDKISYFVVFLPALILLVSGCYVSTDYEKYPEGRFVSTTSLVRVWKSGSSTLDLQRDGKYKATRLKLEYFSCSGEGAEEKSGDGDWVASKGRQKTKVLLQFSDGCNATVWVGVVNGHTVLWGEYGDGGNQIMTLK
ncbi:hypothetical protein ACWCQK_38685 [Streptomyces sp. NPDC002306]